VNTPNPEIRKPAPGRRHARYSDEFKRQVVQACAAPGVTKAAIAMANGLNANMLRRWVVETSHGADGQMGAIKKPLLPSRLNPDFIPVKFVPQPSVHEPDIRIELQLGARTVQIRWPVSASSQSAQWMREVLA